ncbi:hypothetical protein [Streptomyces olivaceoviridis]|uniref:hypothetical protein n=1 Tax=Streptomyces olivaceoviridis TaxID=1921 RepID=UPI003795F587
MSTEEVGWQSGAIRLGLAGGAALAGPLSGHFAVLLTAAAGCALLLCAHTRSHPRVRQAAPGPLPRLRVYRPRPAL